VMWKTGHSLIKAKMKELNAPLAGEMSGHMFFGGDYLGFDDALFAAARLLEIVSRQRFGLAGLLADLPKTTATPEIRVDAPEEEKFAIVERASAYFAARYPVNTIDGVRITFPKGWGLLRASNTQPVLVMRFEATDPSALQAYRGEVVDWLAGQGVRA
jgi:phosphomannomutase/phosphoglucomutase